MSITLLEQEGAKYIELGGGACPQIHPNVDLRQCHDENGKPTVDIPGVSFEEPLPLKDEEWDAVYSKFAIEHISYPKIPQFLSECFRICKHGGKLILIMPNTDAQLKWIQDHPTGWGGKDFFNSASELLFGSQDYPENTHKSFLSPPIIIELLNKAGFQDVQVRPYGEANTDMVVESVKPNRAGTRGPLGPGPVDIEAPPRDGTTTEDMTIPDKEKVVLVKDRADLFDKHYFNGGGKVGGYAREGYWDYPVHEVTARHVLARKPESVLELGAARGYILKRIQDVGIRAEGMEISKHCYMTRVANGIKLWDICETPWSVVFWQGQQGQYDLCFSIAVMEHIPEQYLPAVFAEMERTCKRGLHGIDFGHKDDGFDRTHTTLKPKEWWVERMPKGHEVVDKEELERGEIPESVLKGDGKVKWNFGCFTTQFYHGWINADVIDCTQFASPHGYQFRHCDVRKGIPADTGSVDMIYSSHFLDHLTYQEGMAFLKEARRVIKPDGVMRIVLADAGMIAGHFNDQESWFSQFDEVNQGCAEATTAIGKLWSLIHAGKSSAYDSDTLINSLKDTGWNPYPMYFRKSMSEQMLRETLDTLPCLSTFFDATPVLG
jgi:predicted SAM-dependent methyltransferase